MYGKVDPIVSECRQLTEKEYRTKHDGRREVIPLDLCKKMNFDNTTKKKKKFKSFFSLLCH